MILLKEFWDFVVERENIRLRRLEGIRPSEWTSDPIFKEYSFTNVKRIHDRTTALLYMELYSGNKRVHSSCEALLNAALSRYFGTIDSARANGWHCEWSPEVKKELILRSATRISLRQRVFTSAYIIPNCGSSSPKHEIVAEVMDQVWSNAYWILDTTKWQVACDRLCELWAIGSFMAKEVLLDYILITDWVPEDWKTWTPVGPGGRRGASWIKYGYKDKISEYEALNVVRKVFDTRHEFWPAEFVELDLTDIQFQFCEFDKYLRAKTGVGRPKRRFHPTIDFITKGA